MTGSASTEREARRFPIGHVVLIIIALVFVWGSIGVNLMREYSADRANSITNSNNLTHAFAENITHIVESVDQTLLDVRDNFTRDGQAFDLPAWARKHPLLQNLVLQISIADRYGRVVATNVGPVDPAVNVTDREHFHAQAISTTDSLYISAPTVGRITKRPAIFFVRKLIAPDGSFAGTVNVLLDPLDLSRFYESISIGGGAITLMNLQGVVLARAPVGEDILGRTLVSKYLPMMQTGPAVGNFETISGLDGVPRLFSYRRLDQFGLLLSVGLSEADVFADYRRSRNAYVLAGIVVSLGIIGTGIVMMRQRVRILRSREVLGVTLENMTQGIQMVDADGSVGVINSRAVELLGLPPSLLEGQPKFRDIVEWQIRTGEFGDRKDWPEGLRKTLDAGGIVGTEDVYERTRPNGTVLEIRTKPMPDGGAVRTYTDITNRKRTEADLAAARDAAEVSGRARTEFLAMMSHEIRTPMNSIIGFASLLMDMPLPAMASQYIRIIRQSGNHLLQIINDILDLSKLDAGKLELEEEAFDLREEVAGTAELLLTQAQEKHLTLTVDVAPNVPAHIWGDPGRLRQILINLISNGIKFTSVGSVTVRVEAVRMDDGAKRLAFKVVDTGIGIPAEKIGLLFNHFSQINNSVSRQYGGTGLGLAICKRLVEQMGGEIGVHSEPGRGATFHFDLPLRAVDTVSAEPAGTGQSPVSLRILLADDNNTNRMVIARMLERLQHRVDLVGNGLEAVEAVRATPYDVVIMDVMMPVMDGLAATETIRDLTGRKGRVPIIGLTANAGGDLEDVCVRAGMNVFITKPVTPERLVRAIVEATQKIVTTQPNQ
jgi:signal transduction histidine kinase/CheY-like chemotaxis protein